MCDKEYNGWPNYETWCVNNWLNAVYGNYQALIVLIEDSYNNDRPASYLASEIRCLMEEIIEDEVPTGIVADLVDHSMYRVDWMRLAKDYLEEYTGEKEDQDGLV